jgi:HD superfamily phosphohydrolase
MTDQLRYHIIKDPVHGTMQFSAMENNWIKPFVDSANFQRLRHIKQLGLGDYIFPGAVHTRFNHCLGCSYVAGQIAHKIGLSEEERQLVMIACLLHDVGHGPFSHAFEDIFYKRTIHHEDWTPLFLADYRTSEFFDAYNRLNPKHHLSEKKFKLIEEMIMHKSSVNPVLADIVSSQLDADRLDYLLRDSLFCGVNYGNYDLQWMLNSMVIVRSSRGERLGLTYKGIGVVEHYLMARRLMTRNIYFHQKKLAFEAFLVRLLSSLAQSLDVVSEFESIKLSQLGHFLVCVNQLNDVLKATQQVECHKRAFIESNYKTYKELCDYDVFSVIKSLAEMNLPHPAVQIAKRLHTREMPKIIKLDQIDIQHVEKLLRDFKDKHRADIEDWQVVLLKTPHQSYSLEDDPILVQSENNVTRPLSDMSLMIQAIGNKFEQTVFLAIDNAIYDRNIIDRLVSNLTLI